MTATRTPVLAPAPLAAQALAYQTRQILLSMEAAGHPPLTTVFLCGGLGKNALYASSLAEALALPLYTPTQDEAVLLGAAVLAAAAGGAHASVGAAMAAMTSVGEVVRPDGLADESVARHHRLKYAVFLRMSEDQREYRRMMREE